MNGIILAGGKSLRFGEDKAFVNIAGEDSNPRLLIENIIGLLAGLFNNIIVATNYPEKYNKYPVKVVVDQIKGVGPLGGIHAGLVASDSEYNFVMACDMPFPNQKLIKHLASTAKGQAIVIPRREGMPEPMFAVYSKRCIPAIEEQINTGNYKIQDFFSRIDDVEYIDEERIGDFDPGFLSFLNLNSKKDLEKINKCLKKQKLSASI